MIDEDLFANAKELLSTPWGMIAHFNAVKACLDLLAHGSIADADDPLTNAIAMLRAVASIVDDSEEK